MNFSMKERERGKTCFEIEENLQLIEHNFLYSLTSKKVFSTNSIKTSTDAVI